MQPLIYRMRFFFIGFLLTIPGLLCAQPGDPGGDPDVPIDGGIGFLLAAGALYGAKRIYDVRKNK